MNFFGDQVAVFLEGADSGCLVITHEAAVTGDVCAENSCELTFKTFISHRMPPFQTEELYVDHIIKP
jgi:hypothetical protein